MDTLGRDKRVVRNMIIICMMFLGIAFIFCMNKIGVEVTPNYIPEEDVYGIPFNIGFQFSTIFGMLGSLLLQLALYSMIFCRKDWKLFVWSVGFWIDFTIAPEVIANHSATFLHIVLREQGIKNSGFREVFNNLRFIGFMFLIIVAIIGLYHWFIGTTINEEENKKKCHVKNLISVIIGVVGFMILFLFAFKNGWYIGLCLVTNVLSIFALRFLERYWTKADLSMESKKVIIGNMSARVIESEPQNNMNEEEMVLQAFDALIDFVNQLDKLKIDENTKKEHLIYMINKYRRYFEAYYKEKK